jgi:hypothetical protein
VLVRLDYPTAQHLAGRAGVDRRRPDQRHQQAANLGDGDRDQPEPAGQATTSGSALEADLGPWLGNLGSPGSTPM